MPLLAKATIQKLVFNPFHKEFKKVYTVRVKLFSLTSNERLDYHSSMSHNQFQNNHTWRVEWCKWVFTGRQCKTVLCISFKSFHKTSSI